MKRTVIIVVVVIVIGLGSGCSRRERAPRSPAPGCRGYRGI